MALFNMELPDMLKEDNDRYGAFSLLEEPVDQSASKYSLMPEEVAKGFDPIGASADREPSALEKFNIADNPMGIFAGELFDQAVSSPTAAKLKRADLLTRAYAGTPMRAPKVKPSMASQLARLSEGKRMQNDALKRADLQKRLYNQGSPEYAELLRDINTRKAMQRLEGQELKRLGDIERGRY